MLTYGIPVDICTDVLAISKKYYEKTLKAQHKVYVETP